MDPGHLAWELVSRTMWWHVHDGHTFFCFEYTLDFFFAKLADKYNKNGPEGLISNKSVVWFVIIDMLSEFN